MAKTPTRPRFTQADILKAFGFTGGTKSSTKRKAVQTAVKPKVKNTFKKSLKEIMYCYLEPENARFVKAQKAKKLVRSCSGYVNALIAKDRGVKTTAVWGSKTKSTSSPRKA